MGARFPEGLRTLAGPLPLSKDGDQNAIERCPGTRETESFQAEPTRLQISRGSICKGLHHVLEDEPKVFVYVE